ncbi:WD40 repeat domain-containing protein [Spirillospora sp. NPDC050679]
MRTPPRARRLAATARRDIGAWWPRPRRLRRARRSVTVPVTVAPDAAGERAQVWDLVLSYRPPATGRRGRAGPPAPVLPSADQPERGDEAFGRAVADAWAWASVQDRYPQGGTVTWTLRAGPGAAVGGGSAGAAFAVGLAYLFGLTRDTRGPLDRRAVVSARVDPTGLLAGVGRLEAKAEAVRRAGGRLVVAAEAADAARAASPGGRPRVVPVASVPEAVRESRVPRRRWPPVTLFAVVALLLVSGGLAWQLDQWEEARRHREVRRLVNQSAAELSGEIERAASASLQARRLLPDAAETRGALARAAATDPRLTRVITTGRPMSKLAYSPDGTLLVSAADDVVTARDADTGTVTATSGPLGGRITALAFLPGGHELLLGITGGTVLRWRPAGAPPQRIATVDGGAAVTALAASPDGGRVVYGVRGRGVWVRPMEPAAPAIQITATSPNAVAFPNPKTVVVASAGTRTGDPILQAFPSDRTAGRAHVLLKKRFTLFSGGVTALAVSPSGKLMVSADINGGLRAYDTATLARRYGLVDRNVGVYALTIGSDDRTVLTSGHYFPRSGGSATIDENADVAVFDLRTRRPVEYALQGRRELTSLTGVLSLRPGSGDIAVATGSGAITLWRPPRAADPAGPVWVTLPDPADRTAVLLFHQEGQVVRHWPGGARRETVARLTGHGALLTARLSPAGDRLATGNADGTVTLWHYPSMSPARTLPPPKDDPNRVYRLAFSPDGQVLAAGGPSGVVRLWRTATGTPWLRFVPPTPSAVAALVFLPGSGDLVVTRRNGLVQTFRPGATAPARQATMPTDAAVVLPETGEIVLGFGSGGYGRYGTDLAIRARFTARHDGNVIDGALSADGRLLASAGADGQALLIDFAGGATTLSMPSVEPLGTRDEDFFASSYVSAAFTGDGRYAVFGTHRGHTESVALAESDITRRVCALAGRPAPSPAATPGTCG